MGRILCVTSNFPRWPGDATTPFVLHLASDLQSLGWRVDVLAPHAVGAAVREQLGGVRVHRFRYLIPEHLQTVCYGGGAMVNLRKHKGNYLKLPFLVAAQGLGLLRLLNSGAYDLIHSHWILPQGFTGMGASVCFHIPHILTVHGGDIFGLKSKPLTALKKVVLHNADAVTVNSSFTEGAVRALSPKVKQMHRIPMGISTEPPIDAAKYREIRRRYRQKDGPLLVFAGRLVDEKGVADLIRAAAMLIGRLPQTTVLIVGEGQDRPRFETLARTLGLADRIYFAGWVDPALMPTYLAAGDLFIGPSRHSRDGWVEAQGLTFVEAMAAGTAVIATRSGGIGDAVVHEKTGLLVDERHPEQIAQAVARLVDHPELRKRLEANGSAAASNRFSRQRCAQAFSDLFLSFLKDKR